MLHQGIDFHFFLIYLGKKHQSLKAHDLKRKPIPNLAIKLY